MIRVDNRHQWRNDECVKCDANRYRYRISILGSQYIPIGDRTYDVCPVSEIAKEKTMSDVRREKTKSGTTNIIHDAISTATPESKSPFHKFCNRCNRLYSSGD